MEVFCKFRTVKRILKAVVVGLILANAERIYANTYYTWTGNGSNTNWENHENWQKYTGTPVTEYNESQGTLYSIITSTDWTDAAEGEYPKTSDDRVFFTGQNTANVKLNASITVDSIFFNSLADKTITIDLNSNNIFCMLKILLVAQSNYITDSNVIIKGAGSFSADTFDFPSNGTHKFAVQDETTTVIIRNTLWANSSGTLLFSGNGYLYMPNGGPNVNYGASNIQYEIESSHRRPFEDGTPTYICETSIPDESTPNGATVTFTKGLPNEGSVGIKFPYSVTIVGSGTYTLNGVTLHNGDVYTGNTAASAEQGTSNLIVAGSTGVPSKTYTLTCTNPPTTTGAGITICFYSPDGQLPSDSTDAGTKSFMEIGRISWYYKKPTWTGAVNSDWTNEGNWTGISEVSDLRDLSAYDIEISVPATSSFYTPVITEDIAVGSLTITGGSKVTHKSGKFSTNKIVTTGTGKFISEKNIYGAYDCTVELVKFYDLQASPTLVRAFSDSITLGNLSIAEGITFKMPFDMDLGMLTINSGASFYKDKKNLSLGWLQVQTANYSNLPSYSRDITLIDDFEADSIIILLRRGNITASNTLSAKKDFIIGGASYNEAIIKYEQFVNRPSNWVQSFTPISLDFSEEPDRNSKFILSDSNDGSSKGEIKAGTERIGNFYINGAKLEGTSSGGNNIVIPRNDSAENFCADAIFSTIKNMNVVCSDGTSDGSHAQIPVGGCTLSNCNNFDSTEFEILEAETVFDNRIRIKMSAPTRNTQGELNKPEIINAVKVSDGNYFTNTYNSADGTEEPEATPTEFYIYTNKTSWNMDATGNMDSATIIDVCNYTDSHSEWKNVVPYLEIPQQTTTCGYTITDKWGKRIKDYSSSPYTGTTDGTDKTPTWSGRINEKWANSGNWYNLTEWHIYEDLKKYGCVIKSIKKFPEISEKAQFSDGSSKIWEIKSITIEPSNSLTIKDEGAVITPSITNNGTLSQTGGVLQISETSASITNNGEFTQTGGYLQLKGTSLNITCGPESTGTITNIEVLADSSITLGNDLPVTNLFLKANLTSSSTTNKLYVTNVIADADLGSLDFDNIYTTENLENLYIKSGTVNIPDSITAKKIFGYGGTIILSTASSKLTALNDLIILGENYNTSNFKYEHFAARPAGWIGINTSLEDLGKLPDESVITTFSAKLNAFAGATLSANKNLYINGTTLLGLGEWNLIISQNDSPENFCAEAINSTISNCTVKCTDGTSDGSLAQIPAEDCQLTSCNNFDSTDFEITKAYTVSDQRIYLEFDNANTPDASPRPVRNSKGELNSELASIITTSDSSGFTGFSSTKTGTETIDTLPTEFYIYTENTSWNVDATGTSAGTEDYGNSQGVIQTVIPSLTIPRYSTNTDGSIKCGYTITDKWGKRLKEYSPFTAVTDGIEKIITWTGTVDSDWEKTANWIYLRKTKSLQENLIGIDLTISNTPNAPVIKNDNWAFSSLTIEAEASITTENEVTLTTEKFVNNGIFTQNGGTLQLTGANSSISCGTEAPIKNLELLSGTTLTLGSNVFVTNLTLNDTVAISQETNSLSAKNIIVSAQTGELTLANSYSVENFYFKSGTVNVPGHITAKNILAYGGTINLSTADSNLEATNDFIILGEEYGSSYSYNHFAARPAGWIGVNIPPADIGKLPDGTTLTEFSAKVAAVAGATLSAGTSTASNENKNLYINKASLTGTGEWFITIPQNDDGAKFCTEAIDSTITNCTVKCTDGTANGTHAQIPLGNCTITDCNWFDSTPFIITHAETVADNRIKITMSAPARNNQGELNNPDIINSITVSDGNYFTNAYKTKEGTEPPETMPEEFYIYTSTTSWNTDATGTSIGSGQYTNSKDVFRKVIPCLTIPQYTINEDGTVKCGFIITDKWGKRLTGYSPFEEVEDGIPESEKHHRAPPQFGTVLCPVGSNKISFSFTRPIVIDKNKIVYRTNVGSPTSIRENMDVLLAHCFELISIDAEGRAIPTDLQINKNKKAKIDQYPSGLVVVTLQLTRNATLEDIEKLYIRLTTPKDDAGDEMYDATTYDHVSMTLGTNQVSFIQEPNKETGDGTTFMLINTAHTISDFAINAVTPSYAYTDVTKNIYDSDSIAVHDFSKNQQNYGTLPYGYEFTLISKINLGTESTEESDYPGSLKLFITDSPDAQSIFTTFNANFNKSVTTWLPESTVNSYSVDAFDAYTKKLNPHFWDIPGSPISAGAPSSGFNFIIPKETVTKMKAGSQLSFLYALCDENGTFIPHYLSPDCNYTSDPVIYTLPESTKVPLFAFNITNANDLLSLDQWYIKLKNITQQRGGVTILNNVINAAAGEKTTLKVNMAESGKLDVIVMTLDGNIITYLNRGNVSAGEHFYSWDGKNKAGSPVARGMYFIIVKAPGMDETRKVMVVK